MSRFFWMVALVTFTGLNAYFFVEDGRALNLASAVVTFCVFLVFLRQDER